ncbi:hypothetical protein [Spirosoma montaniterrae]|nr:hypothetical protein [Spirosoma montaniterrae]
MRLVIDVDRQYKKLFMEVAKVAKAKVQVEEHYLTEDEEDKALFHLMEEGKKEGKLSDAEQTNLRNWLFVERHKKNGA